MILYREAIALLEADAAARREAFAARAETIPARAALGRVLAEPVTSPRAIPPFANSAMDGFAVTAGGPGDLPVAGTIAAGDAPVTYDVPGAAWEIFTGAPVPVGRDAVIKVEDTERFAGPDGTRWVRLKSAPRPGENIRGAGEDYAAGAVVADRSDRVTTRHVLAFAALGIARVRVLPRLKVAVLSTGEELVEPEEAASLPPGRIPNATGAYLEAALRLRGADVTYHGICPDDAKVFPARMEAVLAAAPDLVVTTGAVSMGEKDFLPAALADLGVRALFHKVAIRPGKPVLAAAREGALFLALPGNPISTVVGLRFFGDPWWAALEGRRAERGPALPLAGAVKKPTGLRCFYKARIEEGRVFVLPGQASFQVSPLVSATEWAILPEEGASLAEGALVETRAIEGGEGQGGWW